LSVESEQSRCLELVPKDFSLTTVPIELFNPYRMLIMQDLIFHGNVEFRQLKPNLPGMTDGNLAGHLRILEKSGFIQTQKEIINKKIRTSYEITKIGRNAFEKLKESLLVFLMEGKEI
jgi:DNA-binding HxlR family transcriptional regulator